MGPVFIARWGGVLKGFASTVDGILHTVAGDTETAPTRYAEALGLPFRPS
jgi:hypothetical protein